jgi:SAM-dependent methyltransferase
VAEATRPEPSFGGMTPTLNQRGFMSARLDPVSSAFAEAAGRTDGEVVDLGCAYGIATLAALDAGGRVLAIDMEPAHLELLAESVPADQRDRLRILVGVMPGFALPAASFAHVHAARMLHFLSGADVLLALSQIHDWLVPGGCLFATVDTPYTGFWASAAPAYETRKAAGEAWPGYIADIGALLPNGKPEGFVEFMNPMDADTLARACTDAGYSIESVMTFGAGGDEGNAHAGVVARRT